VRTAGKENQKLGRGPHRRRGLNQGRIREVRLERWLKKSKLTRAQAAKALRITEARVSDIKRGKIGQFSLDMLVRLASRAGLKPKLKLAK
jgi:predicted XRE-type DNA-binding protein